MVDCMECTNFIECHYSGQLTGRLTSCPDFKQKPKTNADRIRDMTDEELANMRVHYNPETDMYTNDTGEAYYDFVSAMEAELEWLQQPAEGGCVMADRKRCCCNCGNCKRVYERTYIENYCAIDGHRIGYIETFEGWCRRWKKDHTFDGRSEEDDRQRKAD